MDLRSQANIKSIYRVTGTPENFLTALRSKTWGFNEGRENDWRKLLPGDIIYFHCKGGDSQFIRKVTPAVIGLGVVGNDFFEDNTPLWIDELKFGKAYPYRFKFSEIYLFADIPVNDEWDSATEEKAEATRAVLEKLLEAGIPLKDLPGFPHMGSYSSIRDQAVKQYLLSSDRELVFYEGDSNNGEVIKSAAFQEIDSEADLLRFATSLTLFDDVRKKIIKSKGTAYKKNMQSLMRAEDAHYEIVAFLWRLLKDKGYQLLNNVHVDLFAYNQDHALLIEAKSIENRNFTAQSRKGIVQLLEYDFFEVRKFKKDKKLAFKKEFRVLATSGVPKDQDYIDFINSLNIKTLAVRHDKLIPYGESIDIAAL